MKIVANGVKKDFCGKKRTREAQRGISLELRYLACRGFPYASPEIETDIFLENGSHCLKYSWFAYLLINSKVNHNLCLLIGKREILLTPRLIGSNQLSDKLLTRIS